MTAIDCEQAVADELRYAHPRSPAYRNGMLAVLRARALGTPVPTAAEQGYGLGTEAADAFFAGREHGKALWHRLTSTTSPANGGVE